ncbi:MAG: hypothetical protein LBT59_10200, partial [Clostridiales bacterium]|nr:hypothetical protein [Clostridiales bacterium]
MTLSLQELALFDELFKGGIIEMNNRHHFLPSLSSKSGVQSWSTAIFFVFENLDLWDEQISLKSKTSPREDVAILKSWKNHFIMGEFMMMKDLPKYTTVVHLSHDPSKVLIYGVWSLSTPMVKMVPSMPAVVKGLILPFRDKIISSGLLGYMDMPIDEKAKKGFYELYEKIKNDTGVIETLPWGTQRTQKKRT